MAVYNKSGQRIDEGGIYIKPYFDEEMADTVAKVKNEITEPCIVFPVTTDVHVGSTAPQTFSRMVDNIAKFAELVECDFVACLGDLIDGSTTQAASMELALNATEGMRKPGVPYVFVQGNHDNNPYDSSGSFGGLDFSIEQVFKGLFSATRNVTPNYSENGTDYWFDVDGIGIRVIVLNACNVKRAHNYAYGSSTASWLAGALDTDNTVLLLEHLSSISSQVHNNSSPTGYSDITNALTSFVNGGGHLVQLSGHSHVDLAFITPWLSVMFVCQKLNKSDTSATGFGKISGYIDVMGVYDRTVNTVSEDAWTACVLKPESGELATVRFGAGVDRFFHYKPIAPTTLTSKLSSVTWSTSNSSVATVSNGVVAGVASGTCAILAKDSTGNYEAWIITVS